MDHTKGISRILYFNKKAYDNIFNTLSSFQDETESFIRGFAEQANWITPEGKKVLTRMSDSYRAGRKEFKAMVDENYRKVSSVFVRVDVSQ